ncbi:hypothetical protein SLE2022_233200 [Rubroshorea leprosula]
MDPLVRASFSLLFERGVAFPFPPFVFVHGFGSGPMASIEARRTRQHSDEVEDLVAVMGISLRLSATEGEVLEQANLTDLIDCSEGLHFWDVAGFVMSTKFLPWVLGV